MQEVIFASGKLNIENLRELPAFQAVWMRSSWRLMYAFCTARTAAISINMNVFDAILQAGCYAVSLLIRMVAACTG